MWAHFCIELYFNILLIWIVGRELNCCVKGIVPKKWKFRFQRHPNYINKFSNLSLEVPPGVPRCCQLVLIVAKELNQSSW